MELTIPQKLLIGYMKNNGATEETIIRTILVLETEEQLKIMVDFVIDNPKASAKEIIAEADRIAKLN